VTFLTPPLVKKHGLFVGNGVYNSAGCGGGVCGSKSGELLQKTAKFQKILILGSGVPEVDFRQF
jgi:hypothetical protein